MHNTDTKTRSKIYTYFYGRNTIFQQFIIVFGVLLFLLSGIADSVGYGSYQKKSERLREKASEASAEYSEMYKEYGYSLGAVYGDYVDVSRDSEHYKEQKKYNSALDDYKNADLALAKHYEKGASDSFLGGFLTFFGYLAIIAGVLWIVYKTLSFNHDGEREYDEELQRCILDAKKKGLEKLNIIAEQIDRVEPVVLTGVARTNDLGSNPSMGWLSRVLGLWLHFILKFGKLLLGIIIAGVITLIVKLLSPNTVLFVIMTLLACGGMGFLGYLVYQRFEMDSYVSPTTIKRLARFVPNFITKLGSDESVRVSLPAITVYMFGNDQLYMYYQYLDIVTGRVFCEGIHEYFYEDIVGITSSQETKKIFKRYGFMKLCLKSIDYLRESITVVSSGCTCSESYIVPMGNSLLDTQFIGMRNLIRQKKAEK